MSSDRDPMVAARRRLAAMGLATHWLRSAKAGGKIPISTAWQKAPWTSPEGTAAGFIKGYNLGVHTGLVEGAPLSVVVADGDSQEALDWMHQHLPPTPWRTLTKKGEHWYYRHPGPGHTLPNKARAGGIAIDLRADGGQVVVAPSIHPEGHVYREAEPWEPAELPMFDSGWFPAPVHSPPLPPTRHRTIMDPDLMQRRVIPYVRSVPGAIQGQAGGTATFKLAGHLVHEFGLSQQDAFTAMSNHWNDRCDPPWTERDLRRKISEAAQKAHSFTQGRLRDAERPREAVHERPPGGPGPSPPSEEAPADDRRYRLTDLGNAERLVARHAGKIRFCHPWQKWLAWDGKRLRPDDTGQIDRMAAQVARSMKQEAEVLAAKAETEKDNDLAAYAEALHGWGTTSESSARLNAMVRVAQARPGVPILPDEMDADPWLFNVENGTLDLRTGKLRPHNTADGITKLAPVKYDPEAEAPDWLATIYRAMGVKPDNSDPEATAKAMEMVSYLQRHLGYSLTGLVTEQCLAFWFGDGANGKSTLLEAILYMMGEYGGAAAPDLLVVKNDAHPTELADLFGKRLVVSQEIGKGKRLDEALVKRLTGDDTIKARRMREDFWDFTPTHKLFIAANHRPVIRGSDPGIWRRVKLVPFEVFIPENERDKKLRDKLQAEAPGILAWAVRGCLDWKNNGLVFPEQITKATEGYREEQDVLRGFLTERCTLGTRERVARAALRRAYEDWCKENGEVAVSARALAEMLRERKIEPCSVRVLVNGAKKPRGGWKGISLADAPAVEEDVPDQGRSQLSMTEA